MPSLVALPLQVELGPDVASAGFAASDYARIVSELSAHPELLAAGVPAPAAPKRQAEFLLGRWAARAALAALGVEAVPRRSEDGSPSWPVGFTGSITHGAGRALCAAAQSRRLRGLGIDAERLLDGRAKPQLFSRICSESERRVLAEGYPAPEPELVTLAFSAKESLYKCLYPWVGRFMDFAAAHVVAIVAKPVSEGVSGTLTLALAVDWSHEFHCGLELEARFFVSSSHVETAVLLPA